MKERTLFIAQRATAMLLGPLVVVHLGLILYAVNGGLTGEEILGRTQGNWMWALFYLLFVLAAAIHAPIGLRNILREWTSLQHLTVNWIVLIIALLLLVTGVRAVIAIY